MAGRCGRYPSPQQGGASWFGIVGDSNMPNVGSEWHRLLDLEVPDDWKVYLQPGGLEPEAENLNWLTQTPITLALPLDHPDRLEQGRTYYRRLSKRAKSWVKRYVHAQYGDDPDGTAVFGESFVRNFHVVPGKRLGPPVSYDTYDSAPDSESEPNAGIGHNGGPPIVEYEGGLTPIPGMPLIVGQDFARNPCAVITQLDPRGRFLVLDEIVSVGIGLWQHLTQRLRPMLSQPRYLGFQILVVGDPSGNIRDAYEETSFDLVERAGFTCQPAPTNRIAPRLSAVEGLLLQQIGGKAAFLLDEGRCPSLLKALMGLYKYGKTAQGQTKPLPDKTNPWSDLADALQYAALGAQPEAQLEIARTLKHAQRRFRVGIDSDAHRARRSARGWT
jgi:hypothetical protein